MLMSDLLKPKDNRVVLLHVAMFLIRSVICVEMNNRKYFDLYEVDDYDFPVDPDNPVETLLKALFLIENTCLD